jgi:hypothetical protein
MVPASENSERCLVLDASSSMSPLRGSIIGVISRLQIRQRAATVRETLIELGIV